MKKIKLIPSLAIVPTILFTSCTSNNQISSYWDMSNGRFKFLEQLHSGGSISTFDEGTNLYFNDIEPQILANDLLKLLADEIYNDRADYEWYKYSFVINTLDKENKRLTGSINMDWKDKSGNGMEGKILLKNIPLSLIHISSPLNWVITWKGVGEHETKLPEFYWEDNTWEFQSDVWDLAQKKQIKFVLNWKSKSQYDNIYFAIKQIFFRSWWFMNVAYESQNKLN